jgi:hypothetical protein
MPNPYLAPADPAEYRYAVHACAYKWELSDKPDRAIGLFATIEAANTYGLKMWPSTFEVIDQLTGEKV